MWVHSEAALGSFLAAQPSLSSCLRVADEKSIFPDRPLNCLVFPLFHFLRIFFIVNLLLLRIPRSEGTHQATIATLLSTYRKYSTTACNRPCTEQQKYMSTAVSTFVSNRPQSATTQANRQERKCLAGSHHVCTYLIFCVLLPSLLLLLIFESHVVNKATND